ncbi:EAL domain-containing protein [Bradyrhizobium sp. LHD-71]|uniref:putative bifunctional diguanylate cyclase/phosphodiesterase n=1 Tax=Bradyrhizobium sp. LHD-71 TaxID=3072141 RepID=UPI0028103765|nr:EAL domain-containing protein [Bradyrhizobium sp. LHD-71]MDQ8726559.1 EAL domain-containing protein [Bradyrhizobium sp. LHD-71]
MWHAALSPEALLPPFEEIMLGSLGRLADNIGLMQTEVGVPTLLRAGRYVQKWLGQEIHDTPLSQLSTECAMALREAATGALRLGKPYLASAFCVRNSIVESYDVLALPMSSRWSRSIIAVYVCEKGERYNLIDTIFQTTDQGIVSLATVRDEQSRPTDFRIVDLNNGAARLLGMPLDELRWRCLSEGSHALASPAVAARLQAIIGTGRSEEFEIELDGGLAHIKVGVIAVGDLLSATLTDITNLKRREQSFRLLFDNNPMPMWVFDATTRRFLSVNDAAVAHYGYSREMFLQMTISDIWPRDEVDAHNEALDRISDVYESRCWRHLRADGSEIEVLSFGRRVAFGEQDAFLVALLDVTERRRVEQRIAHMAHHDALTNLPNRALFHDRLTNTLARRRDPRQSIAVMCVDLDLFKNVNDSFGHPVGDKLLQLVSHRFMQCVRGNDLVARVGGDEFAVILDQVASPAEAGHIASQVIKALSTPYEIDGIEAVIGASIGIALSPGDGTSADELIRNADMALYRAKGEQRGTHRFFEQDMDRQAQHRRALETDLRRAFASGEFELHFQPLIDIARDRITGFEALLRWRHPTKGMIPPAEFIPVAEDIGLIVALGEWTLRRACAEAAKWPDDIRIAVNLSPMQFRSRGLVQAVITALAHSGLTPQRLELEITESVLLAETDSNLATLHQLRGLGVRISMDDFGTGYSSLSYLRAFPFDKIKIDRSFVRELAERPDCVAIVRAISGLGRSLGITTTAEGVETSEQLERLRMEGCNEVQGFLFSPARPAEELSALLVRFREQASRAA